ncbi:hypothetical protein ANN_12899 [Periplaneta americana]|uniref:Uncharacterized protein n=1 Tax=Periplaneta americana TaxID=6978 RepID=A0ABQ8TKK5_PERAM|nr:hypothetical protein ANN_12899 [Periplaneta americana]
MEKDGACEMDKQNKKRSLLERMDQERMMLKLIRKRKRNWLSSKDALASRIKPRTADRREAGTVLCTVEGRVQAHGIQPSRSPEGGCAGGGWKGRTRAELCAEPGSDGCGLHVSLGGRIIGATPASPPSDRDFCAVFRGGSTADIQISVTLKGKRSQKKDTCETWTLTLSEEQRLRAFENKVLRKIFGAKRDEVTGEWRKLHNAELHTLYSSPDIIRNIKSRHRIRNEAVLKRVGEERIMLKLIRKRKRNWLGHWLRRHCLLKDALEEMFKVCHDSLYAVMWLVDEPREFNLSTLPQRRITYVPENLPSKYGVHSEEYLPIRTVTPVAGRNVNCLETRTELAPAFLACTLEYSAQSVSMLLMQLRMVPLSIHVTSAICQSQVDSLTAAKRSAEDAPFSIKSFLSHCYSPFDFLAAAHVTAYGAPCKADLNKLKGKFFAGRASNPGPLADRANALRLSYPGLY